MALLYCLRRRRIRNRCLVFVLIGLAAIWWCVRRRTHSDHVTIGQRLTLTASTCTIHLQVGAPDTNRKDLRGTLGIGAIYVGGTMKPCAGSSSRHNTGGGCVDAKFSSIEYDDSVLRLEVAESNVSDCYTVNWQTNTKKDVSVIDCFDLGDSLWYGGPQVINSS